MPVDKNGGTRKSGTVRVEPIALAKVAFDFEVELLRKLSGQIDPRPAQPETIIDRSLTKPSLESGDIAAFEVGLNESPQHQLQFQPALKDVKWRLFFFHNRLFDVRLAIVGDFGFHFALRDRRGLLLQRADFLFQLGVAFLQLLDCAFEFLESLGVGRRLRSQRFNLYPQQHRTEGGVWQQRTFPDRHNFSPSWPHFSRGYCMDLFLSLKIVGIAPRFAGCELAARLFWIGPTWAGSIDEEKAA